MTAIQTVDGIISRISNNYAATAPIYSEASSNRGQANNTYPYMARGGWALLPSLPAGVTAYIPLEVSCYASANQQAAEMILCELFNLGSLNFATNTFTAGLSSMPTRMELGASNVTAGMVFAEVTTALNATPGTYTMTYTNQAGVTNQTTAAQTPAASLVVGSGACPTLLNQDWGVQAVTNAAQSGGTTPSGVIKFWGFLPVAVTMLAAGGVGTFDDLLNSGMICRLQPQTLGVITAGQIGNLSSGATTGYLRYIGDS